jgi:hypothetical protein
VIGGEGRGWERIGLEGTGVDRRGAASFRSRRNVTAELPKDRRGSDWTGREGSGFFPQLQKCDGGTSKGVERSGWERNGVERSGADRKGSSFRSRRNVTAELPKEWKGAERKG